MGIVEGWTERGRYIEFLGHEVFVVDVPPREEGAAATPLLVLHGFPTSSIDFAPVLEALSQRRRVVSFDFLGFGLSAKPDRRYSLFEQADLVEAVVASAGLDRVDLLTHDMGDSIGGEVLARSLDGSLGFEIERRVITNGSIYIDMAVFTDGQKLLLSLPDERLADDMGMDTDAMVQGLEVTLAASGVPDPAHLRAAAALVCRDGGVQLLPRLIRYIEERREHEGRWTSAIERHPAPLTIVWGDQDPVAVFPMAERLAVAADPVAFHRLEGVGHFPMLEAPERFASAVLGGLG